MLRSLSKAIKACQGFKEGNWRWLKWKVRMWGQCWNSLNGRPVSGQSWFLSWRPLDWFIWTLEKTESTRGHHNATQRAHYASETNHYNARLLKPEAVCEFLAVLRFLCNLRKSGGALDSARALIVPSSLSFSFSCILLQLQPFDMDDDGDHHNEEDVDDDKKLCLLQNKNTWGISLARWSRCGAFLFLLAPI